MKFIVRLFVFLLLCTLAAGALAWWYVHRPLTFAEPAIEFRVERGFNMRQAAHAAAEAGSPVHPELMYWAARLGDRADRIVAGSYEAENGISMWELILKLYRGDVSFGELLIVEGWTFRQVRAALEAHPYLVADTAEMSDAEILAAIGSEHAHPEGLFFPDTYRFDRYSSALAVLRSAHAAMEQRLERAWEERDPEVPLANPYEALILASIIEKETGRSEERGLVSSVFNNRLRIGMRLQTDPTVIYGFGEEFEGRLRRRHLDTNHEYNTYTRAGLPPMPIAMPGWPSILAAVQPEASNYLYFVARGDGTSQFSPTLREHNRAVNRYIRGRGN